MTVLSEPRKSGEAHSAFDAAARLAPEPSTREEATADGWLAHFAALGLAAHAAFREALPPPGCKRGAGSRRDRGYLMAIATLATAAAVALATPLEEVAGELFDLAPEVGALNGEDVEWLIDTLYGRCGINPAELYRWLDAADFPVPVATVAG